MTQRKSFGSDNHAGVHPAILQAIVDANPGDAVAYGADERTGQVTAALREVFGAGEAFLVLNGSGANVLGLGLLLRRHEAVICAESAHINTDECGSAERMLGTKLLTVPRRTGRSPRTSSRASWPAGATSTRPSPAWSPSPSRPSSAPATRSPSCGRSREFCAGQRPARLPGRGAPRQRGRAPGLLAGRPRRVRGRAQLRRHQERRDGRGGGDRDAARRLAADAPYLRKQQMQLTSKMRFLAAQFGALLQRRPVAAQRRPTPTPWPAGSPTAWPRSPASTSCTRSRPTPCSPACDPRHIAALQREWIFHVWDERDVGGPLDDRLRHHREPTWTPSSANRRHARAAAVARM